MQPQNRKKRRLAIADYNSPLMESIYNSDHQAPAIGPPINLRKPIGYTERDSKVLIEVLEAIVELLRNAQQITEAQISEITARSKTNRRIHASPEFFASLALNVYKLEQLLWVYCDAAWLRKKDMLRTLLADDDLLERSVKVLVKNDIVLIRMPHIAPVKQKPHTLPEDLLLTKLSGTTDLPRFSECHATFCHVYPKKRNQLPKDVANYDYKRTIDILGSIFGFSDCAATFSLSLESILSDSYVPGTYIMLEPKNQQKFKKSLLSELGK